MLVALRAYCALLGESLKTVAALVRKMAEETSEHNGLNSFNGLAVSTGRPLLPHLLRELLLFKRFEQYPSVQYFQTSSYFASSYISSI